jgi:hypothetical protein
MKAQVTEENKSQDYCCYLIVRAMASPSGSGRKKKQNKTNNNKKETERCAVAGYESIPNNTIKIKTVFVFFSFYDYDRP